MHNSKHFLLIFISLFIFNPIGIAQQFSLVDILVKSPPNISNPVVKADEWGGQIEFRVDYTSSCYTRYVLEWSFSKDISLLNNGEEFDVTLNCVQCSSRCGRKQTSASVEASNNINFSELGQYQSERNSNIQVPSTTAGPFGVYGWNIDHLKHTYTVKINKLKDAQYTGFYITMGKHNVYYIYQEGTKSTGAINCHALLGLGKNLYSLEYAADDNKKIDEWLIPTIDAALSHVRASNCLDPTFLKDLKNRMIFASSSREFYEEIKEYSRRVEDEIITSCSCCASCRE